mmetsp:Transcript_5434/g.9896  ORF Transcript_5434/g.9896 Transcript_5434/m.9896 type:complete len:189 (+) Transcript_5434:419-985(+)
MLFRKAWVDTMATPTGLPTSITFKSSGDIILLPTGSPQTSGPYEPDDFWDYLHSWGGDWMWDCLHFDKDAKQDLTWLVEAITNDTAVWVTDGLYDRKKAPTVSGVGWLVYCTATGRGPTGSFYEISPSANNYRAELLGLCAIHLFALALEKFYDIAQECRRTFLFERECRQTEHKDPLWRAAKFSTTS